MVKKRANENEDSKEKNGNEAIDNKDIKHQETGENVTIPGLPSEEEEAETILNAEAGQDSEADKVVPEEKVFEAKLAEMQDKYLRLSAEFDNYRKRTLKEKMDISKYAGEDLLKKILPFMDDFERALKHIVSSPDCDAVKEGIDLIYMKLSDFLKQQGLTEIKALGTDFSVDLHEAVAKTPVTDEDMKGKIVDVLLKGYYLKDKVIRHSKVVIGE